MKIAIIIPCYNAARFLAETLESVLAQTVADWELVVVDDGSTDTSAVIARDFAARDKRIRVVGQDNAGVSTARNNGLAQTDPAADYVIFLDADDLWEPDALETLSQALADHPEASGANGLHRTVDAGGRFLPPEEPAYEYDRFVVQGKRIAPWPRTEPISFAALVYKNCILTPGTLLIRRSALEKIDLFDPKLTHAEDWDVWLRLSLVSPILQIDRPVLRYRSHGAGASTSKQRIYRGEMAVRRKLLASSALTAEERPIAQTGCRWAAWERSRHMLRWSGENLRAGRLPSAARQLRHAILGYLRFLASGG